jgi:hypothetical protein
MWVSKVQGERAGNRSFGRCRPNRSRRSHRRVASSAHDPNRHKRLECNTSPQGDRALAVCAASPRASPRRSQKRRDGQDGSAAGEGRSAIEYSRVRTHTHVRAIAMSRAGEWCWALLTSCVMSASFSAVRRPRANSKSAVGWLADSLRTRLAHDRPCGLRWVFGASGDAERIVRGVRTPRLL